MRMIRGFGAFLGMALFLAGCGGGAPTPTYTPSLVPTETDSVRPTLPPSWTPGAPPTLGPTLTPTERPPNTLRPGAATLPPTWTPFVPPTVTRAARPMTNATRPPPTLTPVASAIPRKAGEAPQTPRPNATYESICASFLKADPISVIVYTGQEATITWTAVEGAEAYHVWVSNPGLRFIFNQVVSGTTITLPTDLFRGPGLHGWEVYPIRNEQRLCGSLNGVFNVRLSL
ncbi:MAG TPA: hypothetical protein PLD47_08715 [Aggregatilineales bacterium]|nr:hypothetical protein [Anaerolineales bacterium]HRE47794.1 hypothetical protein [Aggregatilineales bacterium]